MLIPPRCRARRPRRRRLSRPCRLFGATTPTPASTTPRRRHRVRDRRHVVRLPRSRTGRPRRSTRRRRPRPRRAGPGDDRDERRGPATPTLDADTTPCTVNSFVSLAEPGLLRRHRLPPADDRAAASSCSSAATRPATGSGGPGYSFDDELDRLRRPTRPARSRWRTPARTPTARSSSSCTATRTLPPAYTVFGQLDDDERQGRRGHRRQGHRRSAAPTGHRWTRSRSRRSRPTTERERHSASAPPSAPTAPRARSGSSAFGLRPTAVGQPVISLKPSGPMKVLPGTSMVAA